MTQSLFADEAKPSGPVECLGQTFPSDEARREHFLNLLADKLKDPEFRKIEGFPIGTDEAILAMSDPPYYTACPNPFLEEFVRHYGKPYEPSVKYSREPMTVDVSVGKTDPIYKAHSYHTKVPHLAIVPSILHYTEPGDIVLDGFAGSGMTGVAAQWCGSAPAAYRYELETEWKKQGKAAPKWGARRTILNDLSPAATFIAANYNLPFDVAAFTKAGKQLLREVEQELGWMYETLHTDGKTKGRIEYTIWSQIYSCPECAGEVNFVEEALDEDSKRVKDSFPCPHCSAELTKQKMDKLFVSQVDKATGKTIQTPKRQPTLISYLLGSARHEKTPDKFDLDVLERIASMGAPIRLPTIEIPPMHMTHERARMDYSGITHIHHFYLPRAAHALSKLWEKADAFGDSRLRSMLIFFVEQGIRGMSVLNRYKPIQYGRIGGSQVGLDMPGVYYVSSISTEVSPWYQFEGKLNRLTGAFCNSYIRPSFAAITTSTAARSLIQNESVDYVFTDPPFGENIYYADLNFIVEAWHRVTTDAKPEAIIDRHKKKGLPEYQHLMQRCFAEYYRVLKPGRWMTVVFSNSKAAVWNAIQVALQQAGFVVAEVTALDKVQGSYRQVTSTTAVKQDLIISAYKPNGGLEDRFIRTGATADSAWDFVQTHLKQLPAVKVTGGDFPELMNIVERDPRRIYDRMASWFIRHGVMVPISTPEFLGEIPQRFAERDGMVFLADQVVDYDKKRQQIPQVREMELFVSDERSAIDWLTNFLKKRPSTYSEIHPEYIPVVGAAKKKGEIIPELSQLLEDNFLQYDGTGEVPSQIHSYLSSNHKDVRGLEKSHPALIAKAKDRWYVPDPNKAQDVEKKREKALLKEFEQHYRTFTGRRLKEFRLEVLRAGFRNAWGNKDYPTIIAVAQKIPEEALQEDEKLLLWYDQALTRSEER
ncbi:MAG: putative methylase [Candidatus Accumulibacter phosphatis]|jgi:16S rRNA G966 N2-methylase RsmD|uniref:Putative methylase n=1 Tax=Candidatus Accumulibacter phosphatis TaxID=327160 RepID=A0A080LUG4_9PROT|nr:DNA methyltransferase [Accumulibacter sp.]KFB72161.1 MAG: putative methylase [Candidatus Accumulibacter phosphatis]